DGDAATRRWIRAQVLGSLRPALAHTAWRIRVALRSTEPKGVTMQRWISDIWLALRALRRRPGFALTVLVTLALGVGATTALFGVYRTVFLEPIALPESDRLMIVMEQAGFGCCGPASGPDYLDWVKRNRTFSGMALLNPGVFTLTGLAEPERIQGTYVTANAFPLLRVSPAMGRVFTADDEQAPGVALVSWTLWQNELGRRPDVLNSTLQLDGTPYTIVGVMPEGFDVPSPWAQMGTYKVYLPFQAERIASGERGSHGWPVIARLGPRRTTESAQADMDRIMGELAQEYPATNANRTAKVFTVHQYLFGAVGGQLRLILGAAALVLLIACGNVAGLLLARGAGRETELAVRAALGASRHAMVRLLFSEALVLALLGGVLGIVVSYLAIDGIKAVLPPTIPRIAAIRVDWVALLFGLGAAGFTALVFGMIPSLLVARSGLAAHVKEGGYATLAPGKERLRSAFIVGQIALGLVLANGAMLLVRSYATLRAEAFGFRPEGVVTMLLNPTGPRYQANEASVDYFDQVRERVAGLPGVLSVGTVSRLPLFGGSNGNVWVEGTPPRKNEGEGPLVEVTSATGDYFSAMDIPLLKGRVLVAGDSLAAATNVVINRHFAEVAWPGQDPLGKRFSFQDRPPNWFTVVGVVGDIRQWGPEQLPQAQLYAPYTRGWSGSQYLVVRASGALSELAPRIRAAVLAVDPSQPPSDLRMMQDRVERTFAQRRFYTTLISLFALAALLLAAAGVYGIVSHFVSRRTRELGIRMALGAERSRIMSLVVRRGVRLAVWGVAIGLVGVMASTRLLKGMVYGIGTVDPLTMAAGAVALALVAVAASAIPAARAMRVSPVTALRSE
ncbi:MAG TPA: ABC transporter permease, partial [Gemmatimonadales bacterium]|nr:ABC transporter permease [Gemmatimonadales bacterium]